MLPLYSCTKDAAEATLKLSRPMHSMRSKEVGVMAPDKTLLIHREHREQGVTAT